MPDYQEIKKLEQAAYNTPTQQTPYNVSPTISYDEAGAGKYPNFYIGLDNEDTYGQNQSTASKWGNAAVKFGGTTAATFAQGTAGLINGLYQSIADGKFTSFYDNEFNRKLDDFQKNLEITHPNYYTNQERDAEWYSPDTWFSANFWADSVFKNAGFAAGAYLSGAAWSKLLGGAVSLVSKGFAEGEGVFIADKIAGSKKLTDITTRLSTTANIATQAQKVIDFGKNAVRAGMATFGEASIEALNAKEQYKKELTDKYINLHGIAPTDEDLAHIEGLADSLGNGIFSANVALLSVTNYIQFPKISGLIWKDARKVAATESIGVIEKLGTNVLDETLKSAEKITAKSRLLNNVRGFGRVLFSPSEAFEEGAQYAIPITIKDYIDNGDKGDEQNILSSLGRGIKQTLTDREGQMSIFIGGLSGGIMETGGRVRRGEGLIEGRYEANVKRANTNAFIQAANNATSITFVSEGVKSLNRTKVSLEDVQQALVNNDRLAFEDSKTDGILSYLIPRIQYGRFDLVKDNIEGYRQLAATDEGWNQLIENGIVSQESNKEDFLNNLNNLEQTSQSLNTQFEYLKTKYPQASTQSIGLMAYAGAKIDDYNKRIGQLQQQIGLVDILTPLQKVNDNTITEEDFQQLNQQIEDQTKNLNPEQADQIREAARDILELAARRNLKIEEYKQIQANPETYTKEDKPIVTEDVPTTPNEPIVEQPYQGEVTEEEYNNFVDDNVVSDTVLQEIANKVKANEQLTEREQAIFTARTEDINNILREGQVEQVNETHEKIKTFHQEAVQRQQEVQEKINQKKEELQKIQDEFKIENWKAEELVARKKGWFPKFVDTISALQELRDEEQAELDNLNQENTQLTAYIQELQSILDNPPDNMISLRDELQEQQSELENLIVENGKSINTLSNIIDGARELIKRLGGIIQDKLKLFRTRNLSPLADTAILELDKENPSADILRQVQDIEKFQIAPATRREQETIGQIQDLYKQIEAKQQILDRIQERQFIIDNPITNEKDVENVTVNEETTSTEEDGIEQEENIEIPDEPITPQARNTDKKKTTEEDDKKPIPILFQSTILPSDKKSSWYKKFANFTKTFRFLTSNQKANSRVIYVTANNEEALGLKGLSDYVGGDFFEKNGISKTDLDEGLVMTVVVEVDPHTNQKFYTDQKGNRLTEVGKEIKPEKVTVSVMPNAKAEWENYEGKRYADRPGFKIEDEIVKWKAKREQIFSGEYDGKVISYEVSRGRENKDITKKQNVVSKLISSDQVAQIGLLQIVGSRKILNSAKETIKNLLPSDVIINNGDAIEKVYVNNIDAQNVANLFLSLSKRLDQRVVDFLGGMFYIKDDYTKIDLDNQTVSFKDKTFKFDDTKGIQDYLKEQPHNINRDLLNSKDAFSEMIADQDGNLTEQSYQNYQAYLISPKTINGENRTAPIYTFVKSFEDKYIVLQDTNQQGEQEDNEPLPPTEVTPANNRIENVDNIIVGEVREYREISDNKYRPEEQLKFNQGVYYEPVVIIGEPDLLELYSIGSRSIKNLTSSNKRYVIDPIRKSQLEDKFGIFASDLVDRLKILAKENRSDVVEKFIILKVDTDTKIQPDGLPEINLCI